MAQPVKYMKTVGQMIALYQRQLIRLFRKYPTQEPPQFHKLFNITLSRLKQTEINKGIDDGISALCHKMVQHLQGPVFKSRQPPPRYNKTSVQPRRQLRSQVGTRLMNRTGGLQKSQEQNQPIQQENEVNDIIESYKIEEEIVPRMRMKWKSGYQTVEEKDISTIGHNNINLLSYAIPQIQNSIRRLSYQRSPKSTKERQLQIYRTLDSRSLKKKYIPRLF